MSAKKMENLTFCLPTRIDSKYRLYNLLSVLDYYSRNINAHYIVLEADSQPALSSLTTTYPNVTYFYVEDNNPVFHRTRYINQMLSMAKTPYAAVWDVDAICSVEQLFKAYQLLQEGHPVMVYPFDGRFLMVNDYFSWLFHQQRDISLLYSGDMPFIFMNGYNSVGGGFLVNIEQHKSCGAENEYFIGWGPEDAERYRRLEILGHKPLRIKGSLFHLHHSRGTNSKYANDDIAYITKKEFCRVCRMRKDELENYIQTWEWNK